MWLGCRRFPVQIRAPDHTEAVEVLPAPYFHLHRTWEHLGTIDFRTGSQHLFGRSHWHVESSPCVNVQAALVQP